VTPDRTARGILAAGAALLALATVGGALGAHELERLLPAAQLRLYDTAVRYQFYHALGLMVLGVAAPSLDTRVLRWSAVLVASGIVLFCGSLYALCFGAPRMLGVLTPIGGLALIAGWIGFAATALAARRSLS
jgi:uncharacterized membrane protein YgdD (TMEM256/DUF423 family)